MCSLGHGMICGSRLRAALCELWAESAGSQALKQDGRSTVAWEGKEIRGLKEYFCVGLARSDGSSGGEMDREGEEEKLSRSFTASEVEGKVGMVVSDGDGNQLKAVVVNSTLSLFGSDCGEDEGKKINQKGNN
ncbi:hypothetical protein K438DRAFT_1773073 [Mycena galopus ATCC 62051]|nr:hypothetical protein K438DRAFT_1773073 [Mycena galopus ATCC 62051]